MLLKVMQATTANIGRKLLAAYCGWQPWF